MWGITHPGLKTQVYVVGNSLHLFCNSQCKQISASSLNSTASAMQSACKDCLQGADCQVSVYAVPAKDRGQSELQSSVDRMKWAAECKMLKVNCKSKPGACGTRCLSLKCSECLLDTLQFKVSAAVAQVSREIPSESVQERHGSQCRILVTSCLHY